MAGGLGIAGFLKHSDSVSSGGGKWLRTWKKKGVGEAVVWLHTRAVIVPCLSHSFMNEDTFEDKETGRPVPVLRYPRFVSPDAEVVHRNQYFRNDDGTLQVPPDLDPFLLLREWLRFADHIALDQPIFKWENPKERDTIRWYRGELSGLEKRGQKNFGHSLDTKFEYLYVVVDNDDVSTGPVLAREGKLLSQKIVEVIKQQQKMLGEAGGDPAQHPYAFEWRAEDAKSPMNAYKAFKREDIELTDEVWEKISSDDFPDPEPHGSVADGDMEKIRQAFEAAAQIDLPLDEIFSDDPATRRALSRPGGSAKREPARPSRAAQARGVTPPAPTSRATAPAATSAPKPAATNGSARQPAPATAPVTGGLQRRRKVAAPDPEPEPEPEPEGEQIPCDECGIAMLATDTKCPNPECGAEYEPIADDEAEPAPAAVAKPASAPKPKPTGPKPAAATKPAATKPVATAADSPAAAPDCWSCGAALAGAEMCPSCGIDQGDQIPF